MLDTDKIAILALNISGLYYQVAISLALYVRMKYECLYGDISLAMYVSMKYGCLYGDILFAGRVSSA